MRKDAGFTAETTLVYDELAVPVPTDKNSVPRPERHKPNRRAFPRWTTQIDVRLSWATESVLVQAFDISEGGLKISCDAPLPLQTEIEVAYRLLTDRSWVRVKGVVRHVEGDRAGIEFLNLTMKDRLALVEFCEKLKTC
jgi:hypothetical protein